ncbi:hypothetical protein BLTE_10050 [Blastochloris tepida]|uniref:Uncharacterized protein n=1 Tax=Blastochloris tepida TaxID=2233851 RepID=A0A348FYD7_9HYPH|nr:hypothetical protein BLTE_10050 [Blastochloris tepida]
MGEDLRPRIHGPDSWTGFLGRFHGPFAESEPPGACRWRMFARSRTRRRFRSGASLDPPIACAHRQGVIGIDGIAQAGSADALPANEIRRLAPTRRKNFIYRINSLWTDLP